MSIQNPDNSNEQDPSQRIKSNEATRLTQAQINRLGDMALFALKQNLTSPEFGTDLDPNKAGNIWDEVADAPRREAHSAEWQPLNEEIIDSGVDARGAMNMIAQHKQENGVAPVKNGNYVLKVDGEQMTVNTEGVPVEEDIL